MLRLAEHHAHTVHSFNHSRSNLDTSGIPHPASNDNAVLRLFRAGGWRVYGTASRDHRVPAGLTCNDEALAQFDPAAVGFGPRRGFLDWVHLLDDLPPRKLSIHQAP